MRLRFLVVCVYYNLPDLLHRIFGSVRFLSGAGNGWAHRPPGLLQDAECCHT